MTNYHLPPRTLIVFGFAILLLLASFYYLTQVWLIIFGAVLFAVFLLGLTDYAKKIPKLGAYLERLPHTLMVGMVAGLLLLIIGGFLANFGNELANQFSDIKKMIPAAIIGIDNYLQGYPTIYEWVTTREWFVEVRQNPEILFSQFGQEAIGSIPMLLGGFVSGVGTFVIILLLGLFFALNPAMYQRSFVALVPKVHRDKAKYLLERSYDALKQWLVGQLVVMSFVGIATTIALWLMDVKFALALGVTAFVLDFIPVIGPWLSAVPILLVTLILAPDMLLWVLLMIIVVQQMESYIVSPIVQQRLVDLPPVALLLSQIIMGSMTGILGVALATPLMVVAIVWVQVLYIKFTLGDYQLKIMGQNDEDLRHDRYNQPEPMQVVKSEHIKISD